jgi:uncharacterized protein (DUF169 family)
VFGERKVLMENVKFGVPLVGVKVLRSLEGCEGATEYCGVSYCDAVRRATAGEEVLVRPGSIEVCRWSPVVLGLKSPESEFEKSLEPHLESPVAGIYVAPLSRFSEGVEPDVVIVRGRPAQLKKLAAEIGEGTLQDRYRGRIGWSALGVGEKGLSWRVMLVHALNYSLSLLIRLRFVDELTRKLFRRESVSKAFEKAAKNAVADMSMCRNSTALPYVEDAGNISFFCTGGVTWGGNSPKDMTAGFPYRLIKPLL